MRRRYSSPPPARTGCGPLDVLLAVCGGGMVSAIALVLLGVPASVTEATRSALKSALAWFAANWGTTRILYVVVPLAAMTVLVVTSEVLARPPRSSGTTH